MPIYEYECKSCGKASEIIASGHAAMGEVLCLHCGGGKLEKNCRLPQFPECRRALPAKPAADGTKAAAVHPGGNAARNNRLNATEDMQHH